MNFLDFTKSFESGDLDTDYMDFLMEYGPQSPSINGRCSVRKTYEV